MITPDLAFESAANRAAAVNATAPPFVSYHVQARVAIAALRRERTINRAVDVRTRDDRAVLQDLPRGGRRIARSFPLSPTFDPLSSFTLVGRGGLHDALEAYVRDVQPLQYEIVSHPNADVVVQGLRAYHAAYALDSTDALGGFTHLVLTPYAFFIKAVPAKSSLFFHDVFISNATGLPARVSFLGGYGRSFQVDLRTVGGYQVVSDVFYAETLQGPMNLGALRVSIRARYDEYAFPAVVPAPELER